MTYAADNTDGNNGVRIEGWGQEIRQYFNSNVTISNQAIGGRGVVFFMWSITTDSSGAPQEQRAARRLPQAARKPVLSWSRPTPPCWRP
jgi:hypothetical protein